MSKLTYKQLNEDFKKNIGDTDGHTYWDFAVLLSDGNILGCYESYHLIVINTEMGELMSRVDYDSGAVICGGSFKNLKENENVQDIIKRNGGII